MTVSGTDSFLYRVANPMALEIFIAQPSTLGWADLALRRKLPITMFLKCCRLTDGQALLTLIGNQLQHIVIVPQSRGHLEVTALELALVLR